MSLTAMVLALAWACAPDYESGRTLCSEQRECPSGFICGDGTGSPPVCYSRKRTPCQPNDNYFCTSTGRCAVNQAACVGNPGVGGTPGMGGAAGLPGGGGPGLGGAMTGGAPGTGGTMAAGGAGGMAGTGGAPMCPAGDTACEACLATMCCPELLACVVDPQCANQDTGPVWNTYIGCGVARCSPSCADDAMECNDPGFPHYCPARGDVPAECWTADTDCSTTTACGQDLRACSALGQVVDCWEEACYRPADCPTANNPCGACLQAKCCGVTSTCQVDSTCIDDNVGPDYDAFSGCVAAYCLLECANAAVSTPGRFVGDSGMLRASGVRAARTSPAVRVSSSDGR